jgi:hypothetical protein
MSDVRYTHSIGRFFSESRCANSHFGEVAMATYRYEIETEQVEEQWRVKINGEYLRPVDISEPLLFDRENEAHLTALIHLKVCASSLG